MSDTRNKLSRCGMNDIMPIALRPLAELLHPLGGGSEVAELMRYHTSKSGDEMISFKVPAVHTGCFISFERRSGLCVPGAGHVFPEQVLLVFTCPPRNTLTA